MRPQAFLISKKVKLWNILGGGHFPFFFLVFTQFLAKNWTKFEWRPFFSSSSDFGQKKRTEGKNFHSGLTYSHIFWIFCSPFRKPCVRYCTLSYTLIRHLKQHQINSIDKRTITRCLTKILRKTKGLNQNLNSLFEKRLYWAACWARVVNWPTSSGPNPKTDLRPKSCPKKPKSLVRSEKISNVGILFWLYFCAPRHKVRLRPKLSRKFLSIFGQNPTRKPGPTYNSVLSKLEIPAYRRRRSEGRAKPAAAERFLWFFEKK